MIGMLFGIGLFELLILAVIMTLVAAPFVVAGIAIWSLFIRPPRRPKD